LEAPLERLFLAAFCPIIIAKATVRYANNFSHSLLNFSFVAGVPKEGGH
jgi:hypothetical protein